MKITIELEIVTRGVHSIEKIENAIIRGLYWGLDVKRIAEPKNINSINITIHEPPPPCDHDYSDGTGTGWYVCKKCGGLL